MDEQTISIREIVDVLKAYWKMILVITLCATILSGFISFFVIKPQYDASTKIFIGKEGAEERDYNESDIEMYQKLMKTYIEIIKTRDLIEKALGRVDSNLTASQVLGKLTVTNITDTQIIEIKFKYKNPVVAKEIIEAITEELINVSSSLVLNGSIRVIDHVSVPHTPVSPNKKINIIISFLLGLIISGGIAFLREYMDNTYKNAEQLEQDLETPVIGSIPIKKGIKTNEYILETSASSIAMENYRALRTNIQYSSIGRKFKVLIITSSDHGEGKTTISGNLALCLAAEERKVILLDCDLRNPSIHKAFGLSNDIGLSDVVVEKAPISMAMQDFNNNLTILTSGKLPPNPADILGSNAMEEILEKLKEDFDYLVIDTPPIQDFADAQILSTKADGTILVVRAERTNKDSVHNTLNLIKKVNSKVIGIVINGLEVEKNNYYHTESHSEQTL